MRLLSLFSRAQPAAQLSPQEACEIARSYFITRKRQFPHRGRYVSPAREALLRFLEERTEFINYWIDWSDDKRWSPAWFFRKVDAGFEIGQLDRDGKITQSRLYASPAEACADFILKELDEKKPNQSPQTTRAFGPRV
jgi:hypothetical protein